MTAFNAVRFRVKPGRDQDFLNAHDKIGATWPGLLHANIIKTGDRSYCIKGRRPWRSQIDHDDEVRRLLPAKVNRSALSHCRFKNPSTSRLKSAGLSC